MLKLILVPSRLRFKGLFESLAQSRCISCCFRPRATFHIGSESLNATIIGRRRSLSLVIARFLTSKETGNTEKASWGHATVERIAKYYETLDEQREAPENPESFELIAEDFETKIMQGAQHPNFFAFFPSGSSYPSILGDMYSSMVSCIGFNWQTSPSCTELETIVLDWMGKAIGLDESFLSKGDGGGVIQGTASEAVAQRVMDRLQERGGLTDDSTRDLQSRLIAYGSSENQRLRGDAVRQAIAEDNAKGLIPFFITATIGTTSTGATDAIPEIVEAVKDTDIWVHIDAAWAGSALVCEEFKEHMAGVEGVDSFDFNMHKWMLTNFDCSPMWVKKRKYLLNALSITPAYLRNPQSDSGLVTDYRDWQLPLGRRFRSLKIWFVMRSYGLTGIREHIRKHVAQAHLMTKHVTSLPNLFRLTTGPNFALITFQVLPHSSTPADAVDAEANLITKEVHSRINAEGTLFLTHTIVLGQDVIRFVSGSPATTDEHVNRAFEVIKKIAEEVVEERRKARE
ncbi:pyridoxal phosphate-dependent transferase [Chytridium lagenaria]|nr:pyridoxal phosphate-dependent transferase [Chytridium lagenaria]